MKTKFYNLFFCLLFVFLSFTACQDEINQVENLNEQETIVSNSSLANLMSRTTANFGAADDILDGSSCFSVALPVTIVVSDVTIIIETQEDLEQLEDLLNDNIDNEDILDFVFPVTIIFSDYSEIVIENEDALQNFVDECVEDEIDTIQCVDFVYPITFSVFNSQFNLVDSVVIENDEALYDFLDGLEDDENALIVSLNFPVTLEYANGETVEINTNDELANAIEDAENYCEDTSNNCLEDEVALNLVECEWEVFLYSNNDLENLDGPYIFNFSENGSLIIEGITQEPHTTTWELTQTDAGLELNIASFYYYEAQFGNWRVVECDDNELKFEHLTVDGTGLFFYQDCEDDLDCSLTDISSILQECPWDFTDGTGNYDNYQLVFNANGDLLIPEGMAASAIGGNWSLSSTDAGLILTLSELTAFQNDLGGDWLIVECDTNELVIIRGDYSLALTQDCEGDLGCSVADINANIIECAWELETNLIDSFVQIHVYFIPNGQVLLDNGNGTENQIGTWDLVTIAGNIFIEFTLQQGFEALNGQWQIVECEAGMLYLVNGNNYIALNKNCELNSGNEVFDCFGDFEIVECAQPNNIPIYNLNAGTIGLIDCTASFTASFHEIYDDAITNTNAILNTEAYGTLTAEVYLRIVAANGNFEIYTVYLNTTECNYFECFEDREIEVCDDDGTIDGFYAFDLNAIYNCPEDNIEYSFYLSITDAEASVSPLPSPFVNPANPLYIFVRVQLVGNPDIFEIFEITLIVTDCSNNSNCSEEDVDAFLTQCIWNAVNYNGSDNLMEYNFSFETNSQIVVIYTGTLTIDATWTTSQSSDGVVVTFSNVAGPNIQAITGEWLVVECEENRLELHRGDDILVLERTCE